MTSDDVYAAVDAYLDDLFGPADPALTAALERSAAAGLPEIAITPNLGRFLHVLALACGAGSILEIGTLGGYSAIWLARALPPDGTLTSLEYEPKHAAVAEENIARAGLADRVEIRVGRALDALAQLEREGAGPFDMVFIDADKPAYPDYLHASLRMSRPGTLLVADNVVWRGKVALGSTEDENVAGLQRFNEAVAGDERVTGVVLQQVGARAHDGVALAVVRDPGAGGG